MFLVKLVRLFLGVSSHIYICCMLVQGGRLQARKTTTCTLFYRERCSEVEVTSGVPMDSRSTIDCALQCVITTDCDVISLTSGCLLHTGSITTGVSGTNCFVKEQTYYPAKVFTNAGQSTYPESESTMKSTDMPRTARKRKRKRQRSSCTEVAGCSEYSKRMFDRLMNFGRG